MIWVEPEGKTDGSNVIVSPAAELLMAFRSVPAEPSSASEFTTHVVLSNVRGSSPSIAARRRNARAPFFGDNVFVGIVAPLLGVFGSSNTEAPIFGLLGRYCNEIRESTALKPMVICGAPGCVVAIMWLHVYSAPSLIRFSFLLHILLANSYGTLRIVPETSLGDLAREVIVRRRAFTLIELLVVIGIIIALAALLLPAVHRAYLAAQRTAIAADLQVIANALDAYRNDFGDYPRPGGKSKFSGLAGALPDANGNLPGGAVVSGPQILCGALVAPGPASEDGKDGPGFRLRGVTG